MKEVIGQLKCHNCGHLQNVTVGFPECMCTMVVGDYKPPDPPNWNDRRYYGFDGRRLPRNDFDIDRGDLSKPWFIHFMQPSTGNRGVLPTTGYTDNISCRQEAEDLARWIVMRRPDLIVWCTQSGLVSP